MEENNYKFWANCITCNVHNLIASRPGAIKSRQSIKQQQTDNICLTSLVFSY